MLTDRQWFFCASLVYGVSMVYSVFLWRKGFRKDDRVNYVILLGGFILHTMAMLMRGFSFDRCPVNNLFEATMFVNWSTVGAYLVMGLMPKFRFLGAFASPIFFFLGIYALMPGLDHQDADGSLTKNWAISLHAVLILISYGAFGLCAVASCMFLIQERNLKKRNVSAVLSVLPPIQRLESVAGKLVMIGLALLTLGLALAPLLIKGKTGFVFYQDAKILWSMLVWAAYAGIALAKWRKRFGGKPLAWCLIAGFVFLILTFAGTNLMSDLHQ
ncbi:MAG: cytochrome c biogenesis protein CcsA [Verrucomicrobiota bacterium]|nr:cytochrome c biogenesis protein CcsA [Verrucomicrobiota bacterium]